MPKIEEQGNVSQRIVSINAKLQIEQNYLHKLQQIKLGLMVDLLSGKKQVKANEEEVIAKDK